MVAFLGGIIAPACGFMWGGQYRVIEICTAKGLENRVVADTSDNGNPNNKMAKDCEFCFANANVLAHLPASSSLIKVAFTAEKLKFQHYEDILLSRLNTDISSRGPPSLI